MKPSSCTTPAVVCPNWCNETHVEEIVHVRIGGRDKGYMHVGRIGSGEGWSVSLESHTSADGTPDDDRGVRVVAKVDRDDLTAAQAREVAVALLLAAGPPLPDLP